MTITTPASPTAGPGPYASAVLTGGRPEILWADVRPDAARRILLAAVDCFAEHGYHGATTRQIAKAAGMSPAAVYVHYATKGELLRRICLGFHEFLVAELQEALDGLTDPVERMRSLAYTFARGHAADHQSARVVRQEAAALAPDDYAVMHARRAGIGELFLREVRTGVAAGAFTAPDPVGTTRALTSMLTDIARWYRPTGQRTPEDVGALYAHLALKLLA
ncbi:TetR/AcrR family transcriptional regulator [Actinocorallia lasiicapitis]